MKTVVVELSDCIKCKVCIEACPEIFIFSDAGFVQVKNLENLENLKNYEDYKDCINEAIKNCPSNCIYWED